MIVRITTDGSGTSNGTSKGPGGWACVIRYGDQVREISGAVAEATNNSMEITAAIMGLRELKRPCDVELITDSEYLKDSAKYRITNWISNGWLTAEGNPVKNRELWEQLRTEIERHKVKWFLVKGHTGDPDNERADQLAGEARASLLPPKEPVKKRTLPSIVKSALALDPADRYKLRMILAETECHL